MQLHVHHPDDLPYIMCTSACVLMRTNKTLIRVLVALAAAYSQVCHLPDYEEVQCCRFYSLLTPCQHGMNLYGTAVMWHL